MGYGVYITNFLEDRYFYRKIASDILTIDEAVNDAKKWVNKCEQNILIFSLLKPEIEDDNVFNYSYKFDELIATLKEAITELILLEDIQNSVSYSDVKFYCESSDRYYIKSEDGFIEVDKTMYINYSI